MRTVSSHGVSRVANASPRHWASACANSGAASLASSARRASPTNARKRCTSIACGSTVMTYDPWPRMMRTSSVGGSSPRSLVRYPDKVFRTRCGTRCAQTRSTNTSVGTGRFASSTRAASTHRCLACPTFTVWSSTSIVTSPSSRNSTGIWPRFTMWKAICERCGLRVVDRISKFARWGIDRSPIADPEPRMCARKVAMPYASWAYSLLQSVCNAPCYRQFAAELPNLPQQPLTSRFNDSASSAESRPVTMAASRSTLSARW